MMNAKELGLCCQYMTKYLTYKYTRNIKRISLSDYDQKVHFLIDMDGRSVYFLYAEKVDHYVYITNEDEDILATYNIYDELKEPIEEMKSKEHVKGNIYDHALIGLMERKEYVKPGIYRDIIDTYNQTSDKENFCYLFEILTGRSFQEYIKKCNSLKEKPSISKKRPKFTIKPEL